MGGGGSMHALQHFTCLGLPPQDGRWWFNACSTTLHLLRSSPTRWEVVVQCILYNTSLAEVSPHKMGGGGSMHAIQHFTCWGLPHKMGGGGSLHALQHFTCWGLPPQDGRWWFNACSTTLHLLRSPSTRWEVVVQCMLYNTSLAEVFPHKMGGGGSMHALQYFTCWGLPHKMGGGGSMHALQHFTCWGLPPQDGRWWFNACSTILHLLRSPSTRWEVVVQCMLYNTSLAEVFPHKMGGGGSMHALQHFTCWGLPPQDGRWWFNACSTTNMINLQNTATVAINARPRLQSLTHHTHTGV